jgi:hypothetical protein
MAPAAAVKKPEVKKLVDKAVARAVRASFRGSN